MRRSRSLPALGAAAVLLAAFAGTACSSGNTAPGKPKVTFLLRSQGGTTYFQQVAVGANEQAAKLGVDLSVQFTDSSDQQLSEVDAAIAAGAKGLIVTVQDPAIGPAIANKAKAANVSLLASPDPFKDASGAAVPVVTLDGRKVGADVGTEMAKLYRDSGWSSAAGRAVRVASIDLPKVSTCNDRTDGARDAFLAAAPGFDKADILHFDYDGTLTSANDTMSAALSNHRDVTDWLVWSCNDEGVVGAIKALANAGIGADRTIGVGVGANLACDQWKTGRAGAYRAAIALDPKDNGRIAVQTMYEHLTGKGPLPPVTIFTGKLVLPTAKQQDLPC
jgi:L-arabinose transport system substrate-binding protein